MWRSIAHTVSLNVAVSALLLSYSDILSIAHVSTLEIRRMETNSLPLASLSCILTVPWSVVVVVVVVAVAMRIRGRWLTTSSRCWSATSRSRSSGSLAFNSSKNFWTKVRLSAGSTPQERAIALLLLVQFCVSPPISAVRRLYFSVMNAKPRARTHSALGVFVINDLFSICPLFFLVHPSLFTPLVVLILVVCRTETKPFVDGLLDKIQSLTATAAARSSGSSSHSRSGGGGGGGDGYTADDIEEEERARDDEDRSFKRKRSHELEDRAPPADADGRNRKRRHERERDQRERERERSPDKRRGAGGVAPPRYDGRDRSVSTHSPLLSAFLHSFIHSSFLL